ncbi:S41 family peptidase [Streptomyces bacillaris]|uniref:PDZ domain-containing protein n=1 Tax=Streptomyces cavourensis TaxID=67258 RepID=A0AAD0VEH4_9ACTN|nr:MULTISPECIES: S41 family peptidase [Streptomyces]NUW22639.1 PDZ domain-containing protein [Streptomyces roseoviolaceus]ATY96015.1 peptidase S41 [Streptomyces cavourensis]AXI71873.1 PDZ domain-containing protein [Streptomyces cavourensis]NUV43654.1 PDZ domain-containing protein [Streptomyces sp. CAI-24]NUV90902.1 PDZ domain-containing protein [Streptomyces sp. KAI-26]
MSGCSHRFRPRGLCRGAALTLVFGCVLATGAATGSLPQDPDPLPELPARTVASSHAPVDRAEIEDAAARAEADGKSVKEAAGEVVSRSGDRWGAVYDEREYEEFEQALDGSYLGVGLSARRTEGGGVAVSRVQPGGPADRAGIREGDLLRTIDGRRMDRRPVPEVVALLRGDGTGAGEGTRVVLGLVRDGKPTTQILKRARLTPEAVTVSRLGTGPSAAYLLKVSAFTKGSGQDVRDAVREAPEDAGILLDLRANSGGLVTEAVTAASAFLDGGLVATYDVRGEEQALYADPGGDTERPVVVLVDGGTMSAAELLTGALQDRGRAVTVGSRTFGKGSVQMPSELADGAVAELTVGHYRTPAGRTVEGTGITPDLVAHDRAQQRAETVLSGLGGGS